MNCIENLRQGLTDYLEKNLEINKEQLNLIDINLNLDPQKQQFGDLSTNAALILSKLVNKNPRDLATEITNNFKHPLIEKLEIAGPGFINIFLKDEAIIQIAQEIWQQAESYYKLSDQITKLNYNIEFVSANPTGPLHLGTGRGGIIGDVLGNILKFIGHKVTKEYYINDAGNQIQKLGLSFKIRCEQELGIDSVIPEDGYQGEYLISMAKECIKKFGKEILNKPESFFESYAKDHLLFKIKEVLKNYGIIFDVWFSELTLHHNGSIEHSLRILEQKNYLYGKDNALWFSSTAFGDDKDRVVKKSSGELTYVSADIAYLENKFDRGFDHLIILLGQDHHGYVTRLKAILQALSHDKNSLDIILYQLVTISEKGNAIRMSKRTGKIVELEEIIEIVGKDVARFFYLNKKADAHLEFDIDLALKKTDQNPVFYIQYAFVRIGSILAKAYQEDSLRNINQEDSILITKSEALLIKKIAHLRDLLINISKNYQTHLLTYYVIELSQLFHSYYSANRVIDLSNINQSRGRLFLISLIRKTLKSCFDILGIDAPESM